jgi:hypothetical protein
VAEAVKRRGLPISPAGVRCVWRATTSSGKALEAKMAQEDLVLTEAQIPALEHARV